MCAFCSQGDAPFKMKRQWVHHVPTAGRLFICEAKTLKPGS